MMVFLDETVKIRLRSMEKEQIDSIVAQNQDIFESKAHFIRAAIIFFINKRGYNKLGGK